MQRKEVNPRFSGSEHVLAHALKAANEIGAETRLIRLNELKLRACEGYYSKSAHACTWPCSITQMDENDQIDRIYEGLVHWADAILVASPIRWGTASSLYFKMTERLWAQGRAWKCACEAICHNAEHIWIS